MKSLSEKFNHYWRVSRQFFNIAYDLYNEKACQKSAASLTYMTLFAIVPLLTVSYAMFSIIPAFNTVGEQFQNMIFSHLLPSNEQLIVEYLSEFSRQARKLTAFGVIFLGVSAYFMLKNIEQNFNAIWNVPRERRGLANFLLYWAILSLGPLLLGLALFMNTYLISLRMFVGNYQTLDFVDILFEWLPWLFTASAFTLLFATVPNCKVRFSHAAIGGVLTLLAFELLKKGFGWIVTHSSLKLIYGAFAIVPLFLMWINLSWMIILGGAVLVRSISLYQIGLKNRGYSDFFGCLLVLWHFHQASFKGDSISNAYLLHLGLSTDQWQRIHETLLINNVITANQQNSFVLSRDLAHLTLKEVKTLLGATPRMPRDNTELTQLPWFANAGRYLGELDRMEDARLDITVEDFFEGREPVTASSEA